MTHLKGLMMVIDVGPLQVQILEKPLTDQETWGEFVCFPGPEIHVNEDLSPKLKALTILHELLECITEVYGLDLKESDIRTLETGLASVVIQNKAVFGDWCKMMQTPDDPMCDNCPDNDCAECPERLENPREDLK